MRRSRIIPQRHAKHAQTLKAIPPGQRHVTGNGGPSRGNPKIRDFLHQILKSSTCGRMLPPCSSRPQVCRLLQPVGAPAAMLDDSSCSEQSIQIKAIRRGNLGGRETERSKPGTFNNPVFLRQTFLIEHDRGLDRSWSTSREIEWVVWGECSYCHWIVRYPD